MFTIWRKLPTNPAIIDYSNKIPSCKRFASGSFGARNLRKLKREEEEIQYAGKNTRRADRIYGWGCSVTGALGVRKFVKPKKSIEGPRKQQHTPYRLSFFDNIDNKVRNVACGYGFTMFVCTVGKETCLFGTGINTDSQLGYQEYPVNSGRLLDYVIEPATIELPLETPGTTRIEHVACGRAHTIIVTDKEGVFTFGHNSYGQCGRPIVQGEIFKGSKVINKLNLGKQIIQAECGQDHSILLSEDGVVYACGLAADGQTGQGNYDSLASFQPVNGDLAGEHVVHVSSRADTVLAVNKNGDIFGWGNTEYDQLSSVTMDTTQLCLPRHLPFPELGHVKKVAAAGSMCALLNDEGDVFVWGFGLLGKGPALEQTNHPVHIPPTLFGRTQHSPDTAVIDIQCGISHFAALTNKGELFTWGRNKSSCLGLGHLNDQFFPFKVSVPAEVKSVKCGVDHMVVLTKAFA